MLTDYFKKPVGKKENIVVFIIAILLTLESMIFGWDNFFGIDACYNGLFADSSNWYVQDCETGERINATVGRMWFLLTLAIVPALFVKNMLLRIPLIAALFSQFLYFLTSYVFYFLIQEHGQLKGHIFNLIIILLWVYFMIAVLRKNQNIKEAI